MMQKFRDPFEIPIRTDWKVSAIFEAPLASGAVWHCHCKLYQNIWRKYKWAHIATNHLYTVLTQHGRLQLQKSFFRRCGLFYSLKLLAMQKKGRKSLRCCSDHDFFLHPKSQYVFQSLSFCISFCTDFNDRKSKKKGSSKLCYNGPVFNDDQNYATPTFILPQEKIHYLQRAEKMREEHDRKVNEDSESQNQILKPKPRSKNNFCSVCRENYEDYLIHVESQRHSKKTRASKYNGLILDLHAVFNKNRAKVINEVEDEDVQIISDPNKPTEVPPFQPQMPPSQFCLQSNPMQQFICNYNMNFYMNSSALNYPQSCNYPTSFPCSYYSALDYNYFKHQMPQMCLPNSSVGNSSLQKQSLSCPTQGINTLYNPMQSPMQNPMQNQMHNPIQNQMQNQMNTQRLFPPASLFGYSQNDKLCQFGVPFTFSSHMLAQNQFYQSQMFQYTPQPYRRNGMTDYFYGQEERGKGLSAESKIPVYQERSEEICILLDGSVN